MTQVTTSFEVQRALAVGRKRDMRFRLIRMTETLEAKPFVLYRGIFEEKPWVFLPRETDPTEVPYEIDIRPDLLREAGFEIVAEYIGHEEAGFLPEKEEKSLEEKINEWAPKIIAGVIGAVAVIALAIIAMALALAIFAAVAVGAAVAFGAFAGIDPSLVVVISTSEGYAHIEVGRWNDGMDEPDNFNS